MHLVKSSIIVSLLGLVFWFSYIFYAYGFFALGDLPVALAIAFGLGTILVCIFCYPAMSLFKGRLGLAGFILLGLVLGFLFTIFFVISISHRSPSFQLVVFDSLIWHLVFGLMGAAYGLMFSKKQHNKRMQTDLLTAGR